VLLLLVVVVLTLLMVGLCCSNARAPSGSDEYFKPFVFETTAEYGTV
jgi:hypothetical protein